MDINQVRLIREREIQNKAREILFKSTTGKILSVVMFLSMPVSFFVFWKVYEFGLFVSVILSLLFFYLIIYLFLYNFLITRIENKLTKINDEEVSSSLNKLQEMGIRIEDIVGDK